MPAYQFDTDYGTLEFEHEGDPNELIPQVNQWVEAQKTAAAAALQNPGTQLETPPDFSAQLRQEDQPDAGGFDYALDLPARALSSVAEAGVNLVRGGLGVAGAAASSAADKLVRSGVPGIQSTILDLPFLGDDAKKMLAVAAGRAGQRVVGGYDAASSRTMDASTGKITGEDRPGGARGLTAVADTLKDAQRIGGEAVKQTVTAPFQPSIEQTDTPTLPQKVASNAGTLATTVAAGVAAGPAGAMVAGGLSEFQDSYDRAVNLGVKPDDAYEGAVAAAAMKMPLEAIGSLPVASAFAKLAKGIRSTATTAQRAAKVGGQMLTEGVTEWTQALADQKVEDWFDYAKKTPETERAKERFESFVIGMVLGGGVSSIEEGVDYAKEKSGLPMTDEQKAKLAADIEARTTTPPDSASAAAPPDGPKPPPPPTAAEIALRAEQLRAKEAADNLRATAAATAEVLPASAAALRAKALAIEAEAESKAMEAARQRQAMDTERRKSASEDEQFRLAQEAEMARQNSSEATAPATKGQESIPPSAKEAAPPISEPTSPEPPSQAIAAPAAAPEGAPNRKLQALAAWSQLDQDERDVLQIRLQAKLDRNGALTWKDLPVETMNRLGTSELASLKDAMANDPQAAVDALAESAKAPEPAAPAETPTAAETPSPATPEVAAPVAQVEDAPTLPDIKTVQSDPTSPEAASGLATPGAAPRERLYNLVAVKKDGSTKLVSREGEPLTHQEAITMRSKFSSPNDYRLEEVTPPTASPEPPSQAIATPAAAPEVKVGDVIEAKSHQINGLTHRGTVVSVHGNEIGMVNQDGAPVLVLRENVATPKPTSPAPQPRQSAGTAAQERAPEATSQTGGETLAQDTSVRDASKESGIHSVYEMDRRGEKKWMVQASDKRGFGDWIFDTKEEAEKASAVERTNAEQRAESQRRIAAKEAAEAKAKAEREEEAAKAAKESAEAKALQDKQQLDIFNQPPPVVESPREATPVVESETPKGEAQKLTRAQSEKLQVDAYNIADSIAQSVAQGQPDSVIEAAAIAAYQNALASIESSGQFNPGFMRKSAMTAAGKEAAKLGTSLDAPIGDSETTGKDMVESEAATPDQEAQAADTRALVDEALATMPERERRIIEETEAGTPDDVIAEAMGITQGSVRTIRSRARKTLAAKLSAKLGKMIDGTKSDPTKLHFDPLFIESVGKPALRIALRVFKAAVDAGAPILDAIERAILSLRDNAKRWTPELEAQARQFFKPLNEADASTLPKPPKPLPTVPGSGVPPKPPKPLPKVPGSTVPPDSTGLTEERTNLERAARGLEPVAKDEPITNEDTLANGQAVLAANPSRALEVMEELRTAPPEARTISREDGAVLVVEKRRLVNMRDAAAKRVNDESLSPEARSVARNEWDAFEAQIGAMDQAAQDARSVWGGFGQMWQRMLRDDFTFDALERKARVNRGGRGLTPEESAFFKEQAEKIAKLEEQVAANQQAAEDLETAQEVAATYEQTIKDLQGELDARPKFGKEVLDAAQRVVNRWKAEAETARAEMRKEMGFASAIPIPTKTIAYLAKMIRAKIGELGLKQAEISAELLSEFGDQIKPYLNRAWKQAQKLIGKEGMPPKVRAKVRAGMKKKGEKPPVDVLARAKAESLAGEELSHRTVYELARAHINAGIHGEEAVMKAVHADLAPLYDGLTERDVRRAFSEYGKVKYPSREATAKELSELRTLTRLQESIDRETAGLDAMHSGLQRDKATQAVREKQKVLNELLKNRKGPPSAQALTSRDEAKQTALRNRIADIDKELRTGIAPPKSTAAPDSDAVQTLKAERDAMLEKLREIQAATNPPKTEAERQIEQLEKQRTRISEILAGTRDPAKPKDWNPLSAAADDIKAEILAMQELAAQMRRDARPPTDPQAKIEERQIRALERAIERYRLRTGNRDISSRGKTQGPDTRRVAALKEVLASRKAMYELVTRYQRYNSGRAKWIESQIAAAEARIAAKDFAPRPKRVPQQESAENARARFKLDQLKQEILRGEFEYLQTQRTRMQRAMDTALQISNLRRALMTGGEMSGVLRQGGLIVLGSPLGGLRAFSQSIASLLSSEGEFQINDAIRNDADAALAKQAGLFLHDERAMDLRMIEEQAQSKWAEKIPWISHTQRFYTSFLNQLRMNAFKEEMDALRKKKGYVPMADAKAIAHAINVFTGRGKFSGRPAKPGGDPTNPGAGEVINSVAFAARFVMSRFQAATLQPLWGADSRNASGAARAQVAKRYARFAAGYLALQYGIALLKGFEDHGDDEDFWDWRSSRFGKVKVGKSWVDLTSGLGTVITLLGRLSTGEIKANSGKIIPISGPESGGFGQSDQWKVLADFARGKLAPNIQTILEFTSGKDFRSEPVPVSRYGIGDKEDVTKYAVKQVTPITAWDIAKVLEGENIPRETALSIAAFFGLGVNTYDEKPKKDNRPANPARKSQREASIRRNAEAASR